ncbi:uncharacterized protein BX664DRAFT_335431 [Halteromyces radiatus]|uniref:uncharacterized protein n=1 Tax=Halteromyces radiatus TaxID=101107 RepID=UPI00221F4E21|nr:uncharacterized protein BX664DRAFT_335431 [Halteromyces radiatus]KAI8086289.1 hypothetical protein BX664DRAFT_335431 [Halteromyces radiatus]
MVAPIYTPTKRIYSCDDDFFKEGNIALRAYWLERDAAADLDIDMIRQEATTLTNVFNYRPIFCELPSCIHRHGEPIAFPSLSAYEAHYEAQHRNTCSICGLPFPGSHWLQLHLDECHNVLNQIRKDRGEKIYECYVESCNKQFSTPKMRRLHLIDKHHYPKFFPFDLVVTGTLSIADRQQRRQKGKSRKNPNQHHTTKIIKESVKEADNIETHSLSSDPMAMDIDALTTGISRINIPSSISFGRGRKSAWTRSRQQHDINHTGNAISKNNPSMSDTQPEIFKPNRRQRRLADGTTRTTMDIE